MELRQYVQCWKRRRQNCADPANREHRDFHHRLLQMTLLLAVHHHHPALDHPLAHLVRRDHHRHLLLLLALRLDSDAWYWIS
ncbi:uncharacterized protein MYCGRDRAFT_106026 [Zymoseptoria tritici IPO323]|uniref:Uncharacterized protein n=1 Tax=Zymoseptoria tritici (strain CBS 115943 / IPO323) TaxID=336722 RepID=F9XKS7_ZYMTI|nr:uncharacterized protein MYCGRDRAFT_106026 [Zymoseptoria tritici IPO323]EGP83954.1 hypothetical protein MYCGRDRAFT_106026 [Zymoseptoria tritici IPO323]